MTSRVLQDIPGYEGLYAASDTGKIFSYRSDKFLSPATTHDGYLKVNLNYKGNTKQCKVHRLVMLAFEGPSELTVNHINEVKTDNRLQNLEYLSHVDNLRHSARLSYEDINVIRETYASGKFSQRKLAKEYGVACSHICDIVNRRNWT